MLRQGTKKLWSLVRNNAVLISPFCLKVWTVMTRLYVIIMSRTCFGVNLHAIVGLMSRNSLLETGTISEVYVTATGFEPTTT